MSKKLEEKQARRLAEERKKAEQRAAHRRKNLLTVGIALIVAIAVGVLVYTTRQSETTNQTTKKVDTPASQAGCGNVETPKLQKAQHIAEGSPHDPYSSDPPTSGPHYPVPADPGFYSTPLAPEQVIHNEEHGMIVIWYRSDAPQSLIDDVQTLVDQQPKATVAVPYDNIQSPYNVIYTAWGALQSCQLVSQEVIDKFRATYQGRGPEQVGVPIFQATKP